MSIAGLGVGVTTYYHTADHEKSGLIVEGSASVDLNGVGLSFTLDQDRDFGLGASYAVGLGGLSLSAGYSSADNGGKIGAKLSF